jgi:signal transduction histidine kinase
LEDNNQFCELIENMLNKHLIAIPQLAMGIAETAHHMPAETVNRFMNEMLRSRIGRRVLAEQHTTLSLVFDGELAPEEGWIGIVNTQCHAAETVEKCAALATELFRNAYSNQTGIEPPKVIINGHENARFTYIPDHIEYILVELLKNSMRFTFERHAPSELKALLDQQDALEDAAARNGAEFAGKTPEPVPIVPGIQLPDISVTIGASEADITFRISDQGGGINREFLQNLWSYSHASKRVFLNFEKMPKLAAKVAEPVPERLHLGLGLPMSRVYANYWGGNIAVHSMHGYGTDAYVKIVTGNQVSCNVF